MFSIGWGGDDRQQVGSKEGNSPNKEHGNRQYGGHLTQAPKYSINY